MKVKISAADTQFSLAIRARDKHCVRCGKPDGLQCSHIFSRRHRTVRWEPMNAKAMCFTCHQWWHANPADSGVWIEEYLGEGVLDLVREKMNAKFKIPKTEEKAIAKHYRDQIEAVKDGAELIGYF